MFGNFAWRNFCPFNVFVILQRRFSNQRLIKISMICLYIKPEVQQNDTTSIATAINEACIVNVIKKCVTFLKSSILALF